MRRQIAVFLAGLLMVPQLVSGQTLTPGRRVRVSHPDEGTRTGTVVGLAADTLEVLLAGHAEPRHLPLAEVTRLEISRGRQRHLMSRAGVGFMVGFGAGAVAGASAGSACGQEWGCPGSGGGAVIGGVFFGSVGGVLGLIAGVIPSEKWEQVPVRERRISFVGPSGSHARGVGLSIAF